MNPGLYTHAHKCVFAPVHTLAKSPNVCTKTINKVTVLRAQVNYARKRGRSGVWGKGLRGRRPFLAGDKHQGYDRSGVSKSNGGQSHVKVAKRNKLTMLGRN